MVNCVGNNAQNMRNYNFCYKTNVFIFIAISLKWYIIMNLTAMEKSTVQLTGIHNNETIGMLI